MYTALQAYDELGIPLDDVTMALRTDEQTLFCDWVERDIPNYHIYFSAGRQLPVSDGRDGADDEHRRRGDPARDRRPARDA